MDLLPAAAPAVKEKPSEAGSRGTASLMSGVVTAPAPVTLTGITEVVPLGGPAKIQKLRVIEPVTPANAPVPLVTVPADGRQPEESAVPGPVKVPWMESPLG